MELTIEYYLDEVAKKEAFLNGEDASSTQEAILDVTKEDLEQIKDFIRLNEKGQLKILVLTSEYTEKETYYKYNEYVSVDRDVKYFNRKIKSIKDVVEFLANQKELEKKYYEERNRVDVIVKEKQEALKKEEELKRQKEEEKEKNKVDSVYDEYNVPQNERHYHVSYDTLLFELEKDSWIQQFGSKHLKRVYIENYPCNTQYANERMEKEILPILNEFEIQRVDLDVSNISDWEDKISPSMNALDIIDAFKAKDFEDTKVVWLNKPAYKIDFDNEWENKEAVIIKRYLNRYYIVIEV